MASSICCNPISCDNGFDNELIDVELEELWELQRSKSRNREGGGHKMRGNPKSKKMNFGNKHSRSRSVPRNPRNHRGGVERRMGQRRTVSNHRRSMSTGRLNRDEYSSEEDEPAPQLRHSRKANSDAFIRYGRNERNGRDGRDGRNSRNSRNGRNLTNFRNGRNGRNESNERKNRKVSISKYVEKIELQEKGKHNKFPPAQRRTRADSRSRNDRYDRPRSNSNARTTLVTVHNNSHRDVRSRSPNNGRRRRFFNFRRRQKDNRDDESEDYYSSSSSESSEDMYDEYPDYERGNFLRAFR